MNKNDFISIYDCKICQKLEQYISPTHKDAIVNPNRIQEHATEDFKERFKKEARELKDIASYYLENEEKEVDIITLKKCPYCGTYYYYHFDYAPEDPTAGISVIADHTMIRCTLLRAKKMLTQPPIKDQQEEKLEIEREELSKRYENIISNHAEIIQKKPKSIGWHVKLYMIENLTDHYLFKNDWDSYTKVLLRNTDPIVRVESARDILSLISLSISDRRARFILKDPIDKKAGAFSGLIFWLGSAYIINSLLEKNIDWSAFLGYLIVLIGITLVINNSIKLSVYFARAGRW